MCGRGTRCVYGEGFDLETQQGRLDAINAGPKQNCLVLDFAGNTRRLGPINAPVIPKPRKKGDDNEGEAPVKACPECSTYVHTRTAVCEVCGFEFPPPEDVKTTAGTDEVMVEGALEPNIEEFPVLDVIYKKGKSRKGVSYFRMSYVTFNGTFSKYLHPGSEFPVSRERFENWWWHSATNEAKRIGDRITPLSIEDAVRTSPEHLRVPKLVRVDTNTRYNDVVGVEFHENENEERPF